MKKVLHGLLVVLTLMLHPVTAAADVELLDPPDNAVIDAAPTLRWVDPVGDIHIVYTCFIYDMGPLSAYLPLALAVTESPTGYVGIQGNLHSDDVILAPFDPEDPGWTSNFSCEVVVYDSLGSQHPAVLYFRKEAELPAGNVWEWFAVIGAQDASSGVAEIAAQGTVHFTATGALQSESAITYPVGGFDFAGGADRNQIIDFDFGESIEEGGHGLDGLTQFGAPSAIYGIETNNPAPAVEVGERWWDAIVPGFQCYWAVLGYEFSTGAYDLGGPWSFRKDGLSGL